MKILLELLFTGEVPCPSMISRSAPHIFFDDTIMPMISWSAVIHLAVVSSSLSHRTTATESWIPRDQQVPPQNLSTAAATHSDYGPEAQGIEQEQGKAAEHHRARAAAAGEANGAHWKTDRRAWRLLGRRNVRRASTRTTICEAASWLTGCALARGWERPGKGWRGHRSAQKGSHGDWSCGCSVRALCIHGVVIIHE